tara:strand:+ start:2721 stop:3221 length:501 start_codon:yes stop_codon:yes gene_type:complete
MKVYKNFIDRVRFDDLAAVISSQQFTWYYNYIVEKESLSSDMTSNQNFQFTHTFYNFQRIQSDYFDLLTPIFEKIKPLALLRIKANMITHTHKIFEHGMHVDFTDPKVTTGIFYINTNNGYTKFENGKKIKSIENQFVEFDSQLKHTGTSCTDSAKRLVINFNYIK